MQPLQGITVVTLEHAIAAPFCTHELSQLIISAFASLSAEAVAERLEVARLNVCWHELDSATPDFPHPYSTIKKNHGLHHH